MDKPKFSLALIARNEATTLPRLVGSLKEFQERGGEICIVDTGSTDNTAEVARSLGCKVEEVGDRFRLTIDEELAKKINDKFVVEGEAPVVNAGESLFDFGSARNYAASIASNDWIWMPDCDEVFTTLNLDEIEKAISDPEIDCLEYEFVFSHDYLGNPITKFLHSKMYRRDKMEWRGIIHEVLQNK